MPYSCGDIFLMAEKKKSTSQNTLKKAPTGISGLDEITFGGLPAGRPTLVCGSAGAGKTMFAAEFIIRGATEFREPGVFMMFEENAEELTQNVRSLGFDLDDLVAKNLVSLDYVRVERSEIEETGEYDLEALFIRLRHAIDTVGAKRVVLDTIEALFSGLKDQGILRAELRRLFRWLKERGMTAVITAERGNSTLTRHGLEEYVADCVILLDHRVREQISTRRLRVVKYRGSEHGTNEYPFIIGKSGISVMPITSLMLDHSAPREQVSTGIAQLDEMFAAGKGVYRGSSILVSGAAGTGKSSVAMSFAVAACKRREKALVFAYEESEEQLIRNMSSIGLDIAGCIKKKQLIVQATRPTLSGLEQHLVMMHDVIEEYDPSVVVVDPISNLTIESDIGDVKPTLIRLIDLIKRRGITAIFTSLTSDGLDPILESSEVGVSSIMDTWIVLKNVEYNGERNRTLMILKSRGMKHSNQVREFIMTDQGIELVDVYLGADRVLTGSARVAQAETERAATELRKMTYEQRRAEMDVKRKAIEAQIAALRAESAAANAEVELLTAQFHREKGADAARTELMTSARGSNDRNRKSNNRKLK
jgi:circadian clock protein KaiC